MSKIIVLAEKPSVAKEIARVLKCTKTAGGYIEGENYIVTWALGHLVTLSEPEYYGEQYKQWSMETLPIMPDNMKLKVIPQTAKQFGIVKKLLLSKEVSSVIIATDSGREGELVARWILEKAGVKKPIKRLWISSQTDKAIKQGFANLKDGKQYLSLYRCAQARAEADWLVGLNVTRALTCKYNAQLSAGRVQTPTLAMIVDREQQIKKFVPKDYYIVRADLGKFFVTYQNDKKQTNIFEKQKAKEITESIKNKKFIVKQISKTKKVTPPPMLYDLTELQRDANRYYDMSAKETLNAMQNLYEKHKALTYPRTDSRYLTDDIVPTLTERLKAVSKGDFTSFVSHIIKNKQNISKHCINNSKVTEHHAIIPTEQSANVLSMTTSEKRIYMLVVKRFLTCFYNNYVYEKIKAILECDNKIFTASGSVIIEKGWKEVTENISEQEEEQQNLPALQQGDSFVCQSVQLKQLQTTPPPRYTEATLLSAMENPSAYLKDTTMKEYIEGGLGTPATRADIIEKLFSSFYIEKRGNSLYPTSKGIQLVHLAPSDLKEPLLTAKWEKELEAISKGKQQKKEFMENIKQYTHTLVKEVKYNTEQYKHDNITRTKCPVCGKPMLAVNGKKGKLLVCQDRECGERIHISTTTNMRCPNCHKKMELFGEGDKKTYVCVCGFREKADTLHKRISQQKGASKSTIQNYMRNQKKEEKEDKKELSAFGKALLEALREE